MRKLIALFALLFGVSSAHAGGTWTILFYMCADEAKQNSLDDATVEHMREWTNVGAPQGVTILCQSDRGKWQSQLGAYPDPEHGGGARYRISRGKWEYLEKMGEPNMGDPNVFVDFLKWGMATAPADHYMVVIMSHGSGTMSWRGPGAVGAQLPGEVRLSSYVAYDDTNEDCLTLPELSKCLDRFKELRGGKALELLCLDACLPSTVEAFYQLRKGCDVMVGSASQVWMGYFDYTAMFTAMWKQPNLSTEQLGELLVKGYIHKPNQHGNQIMAAFRSSGAEALAGAMDRLGMELIRAAKTVGMPDIQNVPLYELGDEKMYWDLKVICDRLTSPNCNYKGAENAQAIRDAARDVNAAISQSWIACWFMGSFQNDKAGGLSVFWPDDKSYKGRRSFYKCLDFARDTHWDEFVDTIRGY